MWNIIIFIIFFILILVALFCLANIELEKLDVKNKISELLEKSEDIEVERTKILAFSNNSIDNIKGNKDYFINSNGMQYKYLIDTAFGMQFETQDSNKSIYIKEVDGNGISCGYKIIMKKSIKNLKNQFTKSEIDKLSYIDVDQNIISGSQTFDKLSEIYSKTIFEVPKDSINYNFDLDINK